MFILFYLFIYFFSFCKLKRIFFLTLPIILFPECNQQLFFHKTVFHVSNFRHTQPVHWHVTQVIAHKFVSGNSNFSTFLFFFFFFFFLHHNTARREGLSFLWKKNQVWSVSSKTCRQLYMYICFLFLNFVCVCVCVWVGGCVGVC